MNYKIKHMPKILNIIYFIFNLANISKLSYLSGMVLFTSGALESKEPTQLQRIFFYLGSAYMIIMPILLIISFIIYKKNNKPFFIVSGIDIIVYAICLFYIERPPFLSDKSVWYILIFMIQFLLYIFTIIYYHTYHKSKKI